MRKFLLSLIVSAATMSAPALAATECETLCQAEFYQTATADTIQELLDGGANVNARDPAGKTPLHWVANAAPATIQALIAAGADVNAKDDLDRTGRQLLDTSPLISETNVGVGCNCCNSMVVDAGKKLSGGISIRILRLFFLVHTDDAHDPRNQKRSTTLIKVTSQHTLQQKRGPIQSIPAMWAHRSPNSKL